jgi:hypothetical protein
MDCECVANGKMVESRGIRYLQFHCVHLHCFISQVLPGQRLLGGPNGSMSKMQNTASTSERREVLGSRRP